MCCICAARAQHMRCTCTAYVLHVHSICAARAQHMCCTCTAYALCTPRSRRIHIWRLGSIGEVRIRDPPPSSPPSSSSTYRRHRSTRKEKRPGCRLVFFSSVSAASTCQIRNVGAGVGDPYGRPPRRTDALSPPPMPCMIAMVSGAIVSGAIIMSAIVSGAIIRSAIVSSAIAVLPSYVAPS